MGIARTAAAIALLLAPTGVVMGASLTETSQAVEEHTSYVRIVVDDDRPRAPGYSAVAGLVTCQASDAMGDAVRWFNDQLLFKKGQRGPDTRCLEDQNATHVWATKQGAPDPRGNPTLSATGTAFEFTDPNDRHWVVHEYTYQVIEAVDGLDGLDVNATTQDLSELTDTVDQMLPASARNLTDGANLSALDRAGELGVSASVHPELVTTTFHTWVVEMKYPTLDPTIADHYNFVTLVDLSKLDAGTLTSTTHTGAGDAKDGASHDPDQRESSRELPHEHGTTQVEIQAGPAPDVDREGKGPIANVTVLTPGEVDMPTAPADRATVGVDA